MAKTERYSDRYSVTVNRTTENLNREPEFTMLAFRVTANPDGSLHIEGADLSKHLEAGLWDGFEINLLGK
jgi:hypothetical protein